MSILVSVSTRVHLIDHNWLPTSQLHGPLFCSSSRVRSEIIPKTNFRNLSTWSLNMREWSGPLSLPWLSPHPVFQHIQGAVQGWVHGWSAHHLEDILHLTPKKNIVKLRDSQVCRDSNHWSLVTQVSKISEWWFLDFFGVSPQKMDHPWTLTITHVTQPPLFRPRAMITTTKDFHFRKHERLSSSFTRIPGKLCDLSWNMAQFVAPSLCPGLASSCSACYGDNFFKPF